MAIRINSIFTVCKVSSYLYYPSRETYIYRIWAAERDNPVIIYSLQHLHVIDFGT